MKQGLLIILLLASVSFSHAQVDFYIGPTQFTDISLQETSISVSPGSSTGIKFGLNLCCISIETGLAYYVTKTSSEHPLGKHQLIYVKTRQSFIEVPLMVRLKLTESVNKPVEHFLSFGALSTLQFKEKYLFDRNLEIVRNEYPEDHFNYSNSLLFSGRISYTAELEITDLWDIQFEPMVVIGKVTRLGFALSAVYNIYPNRKG